jgi:PAS domain-containing protein
MGGCAAGNWHMGPNYVLHGAEVHQDSLLVVVFRTSLSFGTAMAHGYTPTGCRATVTGCSGHEVTELDGRVAADVYAELLGVDRRDLEGKHVSLASGRPCGTPDPFGQYSLNVANFFTDRGGVRLAQPVTEGSTLVVMESNPDEMIEAGPAAVRKAVWRGQIGSPVAVVVFPCALRLSFLGERASEEIDAIRALLPGVLVVGCYSFGEQGLADNGVNRHNNEVITLLALGNELSPAARTAAENARMTEVLRLKSEEQSLLLDTIDTQVWYLTDVAMYGTLNRAHADFLGLDPDEAKGRNIEAFLPPDVAKACRDGNVAVFESRKRIHTEEWIPDSRGELVGGIETIIDYTELKRAQDAVAEREERLQLALEGGGLGMWDWNIVSGEVLNNEAGLRILGHGPETVKATVHTWQCLVHPDDLGSVQAALNAHLEGRTPSCETEYRLCGGSDEWRWILSRGKVTRRDEAGRPHRMVGTNLDVSERKQFLDLSVAQRDIAIGLSSSSNLIEALNRMIDTVLPLGVADCGGVYLIDENNGAMDLVAHRGLSPEFVESGRHFSADSPQAHLVSLGKPVYRLYSDLLSGNKTEAREKEGLRAFGAVPVQHEGQTIAVLNVASHTHDDLPVQFRNGIEAIAAQIGGAIAK